MTTKYLSPEDSLVDLADLSLETSSPSGSPFPSPSLSGIKPRFLHYYSPNLNVCLTSRNKQRVTGNTKDTASDLFSRYTTPFVLSQSLEVYRQTRSISHILGSRARSTSPTKAADIGIGGEQLWTSEGPFYPFKQNIHERIVDVRLESHRTDLASICVRPTDEFVEELLGEASQRDQSEAWVSSLDIYDEEFTITVHERLEEYRRFEWAAEMLWKFPQGCVHFCQQISKPWVPGVSD